jgi:hypothetical protein
MNYVEAIFSFLFHLSTNSLPFSIPYSYTFTIPSSLTSVKLTPISTRSLSGRVGLDLLTH